MSSTYRVSMCIRQLATCVPAFDQFCKGHTRVLDRLLKLRNQHDHMHIQIASDQVGSGPILLSLGEDGNTMCFRDIKFPLIHMNELIECLYKTIATLYPRFDPASTPKALGPLTISMTVQIG